MARPSSGATGFCFILASSRIVCGSRRRSFLLPTRMMGTLGQKWRTSGVHFSGMFSRESGESMLKHMRITSVSGYDSGRSRS
uniref:Putative secreted protein n=1 Tax=Ixodes ricinus TaxID=34613 RepID=A0A6B0U6Z2_IXORI